MYFMTEETAVHYILLHASNHVWHECVCIINYVHVYAVYAYVVMTFNGLVQKFWVI